MRGLYTALLLDKLATKFARRFAVERCAKPSALDVGAGFDLIVGTSTGGIIACGLGAGLSTAELVSLYENTGPHIFTNPMPRGRFAFGLWLTRNFRRAANSPVSLREALQSQFGNWTLADVYEHRRIALAVPALRFSLRDSFIFATPHFADRDRGNYRLVDVCLATSAAPLYFPIAFVGNVEDQGSHRSAFVDGGLWANNPIVVALEEALDLAAPGRPLEIVSITTCAQPQSHVILPERANWGVWDWKAGGLALSAALDAQSSRYTGIVRVLADHLNRLGRTCSVIRIDSTPAGPGFSDVMGMDQASREAIGALKELANRDAEEVFGGACKMKEEGSTKPTKGGRETRRWNDLGMLYDIFEDMPEITIAARPEKMQGP